MSDLTTYTYEVYEILHGDWNGVVPEGAFRANGRPGWLVPDSRLVDIAAAYRTWIDATNNPINADHLLETWSAVMAMLYALEADNE